MSEHLDMLRWFVAATKPERTEGTPETAMMLEHLRQAGLIFAMPGEVECRLVLTQAGQEMLDAAAD